MAVDWIKRKNFLGRLNNVKQSDWVRALGKLDLSVVPHTSGTSHTFVVRRPGYSIDDPKSVIAVLQNHLYKQANKTILKEVLSYGLDNKLFTEDDLWKQLGFL